jgi:predicted RNase H-like HicB family nuclease
VIEKDSGGYYVASVPALKGCHTQAKSLDKLVERIREAIELCLEVQGQGYEPLEFVGVQKDQDSRMTRLPRLTGRRVIAALKKAGLEVVRIKGSHHDLTHPGEGPLSLFIPART